VRGLAAAPPQLTDMAVDLLLLDLAEHREVDVLGALGLEDVASQARRPDRRLAALRHQIVDVHWIAASPPELENVIRKRFRRSSAEDVLGALGAEDVAGRRLERVGEEPDLARVVVDQIFPLRYGAASPPQLQHAREEQPGVEDVLGTFGGRIVDDVARRSPVRSRCDRTLLGQVVQVPAHAAPPRSVGAHGRGKAVSLP
jgi:hypothetical protein